MVHEIIAGTYRQTNLANESAEYLAKREELRLAEIDLMSQREKVAALRRQLPPGAIRITLPRISTWLSWPRPICPRCAHTHAREAGTSYAC